MGNIIDYVKEYGGFTFKEMAFSEVDSLVLSQLSYMNFGKPETCGEKFTAKISVLPSLDEFLLTENVREPQKNLELLYAAAKSRRFGDVGISRFVDLVEDEKCEKQFAAMTFKIDSGICYIAFRGTDANLVGWKEDFNFSFLKKAPSQEEALRYFKKTAKKLKGKYILGGHSKGGNLAVFAGVKAPAYLRRKLLAIYDHDGPGFSENAIKEKSLKRIYPIIHKTIPQSAVIGLLFNYNIPFTVVESRAFALMQHDPFTWQVEKNAFKTCKSTDFISKYTSKKINRLLLKLDNEKRKLFVDSLYAAVKQTGAKTYFELFENKNASAKIILKSIKTADPEVRELLKSVVGELFAKEGEEKAARFIPKLRK